MKFIQNLFRCTSKFAILLAFFILGNVDISMANNLLISNFQMAGNDTAANTITYTCDVAYENSWRNVTNYDAVWVFLKFSTDAGATWSHASMAGAGTTPSGFSAPTDFEIMVPQDEKGFFLQRTDLRSGNINATGLRFVWDYAQDGLSDEQALAANTINKIYGIEMVFVPQGAFYAGDGASSSEARFKQGGADDDAWYIQTDDAIMTTNSSADGYFYQSSGGVGENNTGDIFLIPSSFPKGFKAFYTMKYELTEGQWVAFFNNLSNAQKLNRDITSATQGGKASDAVINRNTIAWDSANPSSNATSTRLDRPVSYISWPDLLAYADWAGLRPLTELEYEKSARGKDITPVIDEYAWGTTTSNDALATEITPDTDEAGAEQILDGSANLNRNALAWSSGDGRVGGNAAGQIGPLRVGIFAEASTNRVTSGSGYYGAMELSGNLFEMIVTLGRSEGRKFLGTHGDGYLSTVSAYEGYATNIDWPGIDSTDAARGVTGTIGSGYRGGDFQSSNVRLFQVSTRAYAAKDADTEGKNQRYDVNLGIFQGGRLGRTAP